MKPKTIMALAIAVCGLTAIAPASAQPGLTLEVTVTNLSSGQIMSPPVVVAHGQAASPELAMLAEDAVSGPLISALGKDPRVSAVVIADGAIPPGGSRTIKIRTDGAHRSISVAGMLVTTNDGLYAVRNVRALRSVTDVYAHAWDAGSEANNEDCAYIPGPPCGNPGSRTATSEGFIHIHNGIHGQGSLEPALFDWRNPVAKVTVQADPSFLRR